MHRPNLAGVINPDDLFKKGGHDYVAWARIAHYLHEKANGWECDMRCAPDGTHVWKAPNGTGYIVLYFQGPEGQVTADFPYAITNHRNYQAIKLEQIDSATHLQRPAPWFRRLRRLHLRARLRAVGKGGSDGRRA